MVQATASGLGGDGDGCCPGVCGDLEARAGPAAAEKGGGGLASALTGQSPPPPSYCGALNLQVVTGGPALLPQSLVVAIPRGSAHRVAPWWSPRQRGHWVPQRRVT